jgi:hypothetical protein
MESTMVKRQKRAAQKMRNKLALYKGIGPGHTMAVTLCVSSQYNATHAGTLQTFGFATNYPAGPFQSFTTSEKPSYIDWLTLAYEAVYTRASRITVTAINSTVPDSIQFVLAKDGNTLGSHTINSLGEMRDSRSALAGYYTGGSNQVVLRSQFTPRGDMGIIPSSPDNICTLGAAPPNPYFWILGQQAVGAGTGNVALKIEIQYDLEFVQLISPAPT